MHDTFRSRVQPLLQQSRELAWEQLSHLTFANTLVQNSTGVEGFGNETRTLAGADLLISICDLFGNSIILYRCWALWNKDYRVVVLPTMCALGGLGKWLS